MEEFVKRVCESKFYTTGLENYPKIISSTQTFKISRRHCLHSSVFIGNIFHTFF